MRNKFMNLMFKRVQVPFSISRKKRTPTSGVYYQGKKGMIRYKNQSYGKKRYQEQINRYKI